MKERFFLDVVDVLGNQFFINKRVENAVAIFSHPAKASFASGNQAMVAAQGAKGFIAIIFFPEGSFAHESLPEVFIPCRKYSRREKQRRRQALRT